MDLQVEPHEKTKTSSAPASFSSLPNELAVDCLARISSSYYPRLSIVSKTFRSLLSSSELYVARSHLGNTERCLYVLFMNYNLQFPQWFRLCTNPNQTLTKPSMTKNKNKSLVPVPCSNFPSLSKSIVVVGYEIYVIGGPVDKEPSSAVRILDCASHTWRNAPSMNVAREYAASCFHDGKIYVMGGSKEGESWGEVFDVKTQVWELLPHPGVEAKMSSVRRIVETEGKIMFVSFNDMCFGYDTKERKWECCGKESVTFPRSECVIENVSYRFGWYDFDGCRKCEWYDVKDGKWKEVNGIDSLWYEVTWKVRRGVGTVVANKYRDRGLDSCISKLASCGGKLLVIWDGFVEKREKRSKIWYAEIAVGKRHRGEVWGKVEWVGVVHTVRKSCRPFHSLVVSI